MKCTIVITVIVLLSGQVFAQSATGKDDIMVPVLALFKGMHAGDSAQVHGAFASEVTFVSIYIAKNGKPVLRKEPLDEFLNAVGTAHAETWSEPIWDVEVSVDGNFAQVWASYAFYLGKKFSHCGVDAFHLFRSEDGRWRIFHLADTRQREGCVVPVAVSDQFK